METTEFPETCWRSRRVIFNERDEVAFSRVLREFCPKTAIFEDDRRSGEYVEFTSAIPNIAHSRCSEINIVMPSPGQEGYWEMSSDRRRMIGQSICRFTYTRSYWKWCEPDRAYKVDPPFLMEGEFVAYFPCHDPVMQKFAMKVFRLMTKVTWNFKRYEPIPIGEFNSSGSGVKGLGACKWSQTGGPVRRSLSGYNPIDPSIDIRLNKYYDDSLWDDRLPETSTMQGVEYLEWHALPVRRRAPSGNLAS